MLREPQLVLLLALGAHFPPLHDVLSENLRDALRVLDGFQGLDAAGVQAAGFGEGFVGEAVGGGVEFGVVCRWRKLVSGDVSWVMGGVYG